MKADKKISHFCNLYIIIYNRSKGVIILKKLSFIAIPLIAIMLFVGCSHSAEVSKNTDENLNVSVSTNNSENSTTTSVTEFESSTQVSTTETTTAHTTTTKPKETEKSTVVKPDDKKSAVQTTTKKKSQTQTTKKAKQTTTKKVTTTKKTTTTSAPYWCDEGGTHHSCEVGPIGWVSSYSEAQKKALRYIDDHADSGNFLVKECHNCGKFTAYITLD